MALIKRSYDIICECGYQDLGKLILDIEPDWEPVEIKCPKCGMKIIIQKSVLTLVYPKIESSVVIQLTASNK